MKNSTSRIFYCETPQEYATFHRVPIIQADPIDR